MRVFQGKNICSSAIYDDFALVKAKKADKSGNLVLNTKISMLNMCTFPQCVIAKVEEIVETVRLALITFMFLEFSLIKFISMIPTTKYLPCT